MFTLQPKSVLALYREDVPGAMGRAGRASRAMTQAIDDYGAGLLTAPDECVRVWSDLHLGHANIIRYQARPFADVAAMDAALWSAWYNDVGPDDVLVCVGDFAFCDTGRGSLADRVRAAPGARRLLVIGNHDLSARGRLRVTGFDAARALYIAPGDPPLIWTHGPLPVVPAGYVNIHGHTHGRNSTDNQHINVSVEQLDYRPVPLSHLRRLARALLDGLSCDGTTLARMAAAQAAADVRSAPSQAP